MSILEGIGLEFQESMSGYIVAGETNLRRGAVAGRDLRTTIRFDVWIVINDLKI